MVFSDSHCHLVGQKPERLAQVLQDAKRKGVNIMVSMGIDLESSAGTIRLAQSHREIRAAVGIHPWNAIRPTGEVRQKLNELAGQEGVVTIGEVGLDYARTPETREIQQELLVYELSLARETGLPLSIHCREAHQDMVDILRRESGSGIKGVIHGFNGDRHTLDDWLALGLYISVGRRGILLDELPAVQAAIGEIPLDRLLTETDAAGPTVSPTDVVIVAEKLAALRGMTTEEIANTTTANLKRLLKRS